jgi:hypothetical protein
MAFTPPPPPLPPPQPPVTKADWQALVVWHLQMASGLLVPNPPADAVTVSGRASAHARTADAIQHALDGKSIP